MFIEQAKIHIPIPEASSAHGILTGAADGAPIRNLPAYTNASGQKERQDILRELRELDEKRIINIELPCSSSALLELDKGGGDTIQAANPAYCNVAAYANEWKTHRAYNDFMRPDSPVHYTKTFQAEIYEDLLAGSLSRLTPKSRALDAGAGVGRMAKALTKTGARADYVDSSVEALKAAWRVLCESGAQNYDIIRGDINDLSTLESDAYDLVLALELLCYVQRPEEAAAGLHRVCKPGGVMAFSVENKTGAVLGDKNLTLEDVAELSCSDILCVPGYCYTRYFTKDAAADLAENAGFKVISVTGCHYLADGPFGAAATETSLANPEKRARMHELERLCRTLPFIEKTARAWLVIATK